LISIAEATPHEKFPLSIVLLANFISVLIYFIGIIIVLQIGLIWMIIYIIYIIILEISLLKKNCVYCYYYGKRCAFGKGKLASFLFKKGDLKKLPKRQITWKDILPDFLVSVIPILLGIILLILNFNWILIILIIILFFLAFIAIAIIRTISSCKYCKQRELGCPAEKLFDKTKKL